MNGRRITSTERTGLILLTLAIVAVIAFLALRKQPSATPVEAPAVDTLFAPPTASPAPVKPKVVKKQKEPKKPAPSPRKYLDEPF